MKKITDEYVEEHTAQLWSSAIEQHGSASKVPRDESSRIGEITRGLFVLQVWQKNGSQGSPLRFLYTYGVSHEIAENLVSGHLGKQHLAADKEVRPVKRAVKWRALEEWASKNTYKEVTTEEVAEVAGFSVGTVLKYLTTSPYFRKIKRGTWEVRDPKSDREYEKTRG